MRTLLGLALFLLVIFTKQGASQTAGSSLKLYVDSLPAIPKIYGYSNESGTPKSTTLTIGMFAKKWKFHRDLPSTTVFVFGTSADTATFPGPVIEALQGVPLYVKWENHLPQAHILPWDKTIPTAIPRNAGVPAVVHLHGGVNEPQSDGSAFAWFTPGYREKGEAWSKEVYTYPNVQHPGNLLYHDHALGLTRINLLAGLLGAYVIRNPKVEHPFGLPSGDLYDRHLILADRSFNADGSIYMNKTGNNPSIHPQWQPEYFGDAIVVNGKAWPYLKVRRRKYRFRITNVSNARHFLLALSNGLPFIVVGSDSSYLSAPVRTATILLAPAEGFDVVIDFSKATAGEAELTNSAPYPYPGGIATDLPNSRVMKFIIAAGNAKDESRIPTNLASYSAAKTSDASVKRYITLYEYMSATDGPTHLYINGKRFTDPVTEKPKAGSTEVWEVINLTADHHPLHIHLAVFQAIKAREIVDLETFKNCMTQFKDAVKCNISSHATGKILNIPAHEKTWKNVVKIEPGHMTTIVVKFRLVDTDEPYPFDATAQPGYVYHCHILDHEDNEMIRPMNLVK
ncbi:unnamed protein product [Spirodela intermedia]|uniref:Uncharacterized protein n=1 Tax=Spirodela intermedia TaxID=51605 RepID=A0A7I8KWT9_SPIIN|nr:unnamed protein product [Spirodela intermedia]